jgi:hypothetical protein
MNLSKNEMTPLLDRLPEDTSWDELVFQLYQEGISPDQIFEDAGISLDYFQDDYCRSCLKRWVEKFNSEGEDSLRTDERGRGATGRPPGENLEDLTYDELLALVEIQQEALEDVRKQNALARKKKK